MPGGSSNSKEIAPSTSELVLDSKVVSKLVMSSFVMMQLGERQFRDGTRRPVYRDDGGRQFVLDDDGGPVNGVSLHPDEYHEPVVIELPS